MRARRLLTGLIVALWLPSQVIAQTGLPDDLPAEDAVYVGKLTVWFELVAAAAFDLDTSLAQPAPNDLDREVRTDSSIGVILAVEQSVLRADEIGPVIEELQPRAERLYGALGDAARTCDRVIAGHDSGQEATCRQEMTTAYDDLLTWQIDLGLFVEPFPEAIERAPRGPGTPAAHQVRSMRDQ